MRRVHLAQALEALHVDFGVFGVLGFLQFADDAITLGVVQRVEHLFGAVDPVQRRHHRVNPPGLNQRREMPGEQGAEQRGDMRAVGIGVRQQAHPPVAQAGQIRRPGIDAERYRHIMYLARGQHLARCHLPGIQNFPAQRQNRLKLAVPRLLRRAAGRIALNQKQFGGLQVLTQAVRQFARQGRAARDPLARHRAVGAQPAGGVVDGDLGDFFRYLHMPMHPETERIAHRRRQPLGQLRCVQPLLGLPAESGLRDFQRYHAGRRLPYILRRQLEATRQQIAHRAECAHRIHQPLTQCRHMAAASGGRH